MKKCELRVSGGGSYDIERVYRYEFSLFSIGFYKGQNSLLKSPFNTLNIVFTNDFEVFASITCTDEDLTLSISPSDIEKLLDNKFSFY